MQTLQFVNTSGAEPWKNEDAKKFVRSHAMKDYRRRQREGTGKIRRKGAQPGEGSFALVTKKKVVRAEPDKRVSVSTTVIPFRPNSPKIVDILHAPKPLGPVLTSPSISMYTFPTSCMPGGHTFDSLPSPPASVVFSLPSPSPSATTSSSSRSHSQTPLERVSRVMPQDFDMKLSTAVLTVLDNANGSYERIINIYFKSTHSWLTIIRKQRFIQRVAASRIKADARVAILLLSMRLVAEPFDHAKTNYDASRDTLYVAAKHLHRLMRSSKGPSLELIQSGILIALFEHNSYIPDIAYNTLSNCVDMARALGLDISCYSGVSRSKNVSALEEEWKRTYWGMVTLERVIMLHDEKHERATILPEPSLEDALPAVRDEYWDHSDDEASVPGSSYIVSSFVPKDADSFCRQVQASRVMGLVQALIRIPYENDPAVIRGRVFEVDRLLQNELGKLLFDCDGGCTQYCGPISLCVAGSFLLHDYQLRATLTSSDKDDQEAAYRSKLSLAKLISIMVDILRAFPLQHLPELSPSALYCPYLAAMHSLQLDRINGVRSSPTLAGNDFELLIVTLKHFSKMWKCTSEYVKNIERAQARALPLPAVSLTARPQILEYSA
ncbi:hypothetical protein EJ08DRAFT_366111 [Tothia fuscella]|uniref:Xylanolytic transcriptional activator regulatory domain-containing protein n=1 Tax=Tothia fuscella TaxID=1048955 RepID=A0A9P4NLE0_9PEZI|nr:hypothetical protein EJ08DRAFT_366111 [Tothia fuscella]